MPHALSCPSCLECPVFIFIIVVLLKHFRQLNSKFLTQLLELGVIVLQEMNAMSGADILLTNTGVKLLPPHAYGDIEEKI